MPTGFRTWHTQRRYQYIVGISSPEAIDAYLHRGQGYSMWDEMPERYRDNVRTAISGAADLVAHPTHAIRAIRRDWQEEGLVGVLGAANRNLNPLYGVSKSGANWVQAMREGRYEDAVRAGVDWTVATEGALLAGKGTLKVGESVLGRLRGALSREVPTEAALAAEGELGAYETAVEGGRHAGFLENYANKPIAEIERGSARSRSRSLSTSRGSKTRINTFPSGISSTHVSKMRS